MLSKLYILYTLFIYMYTEVFLLLLIKVWERTWEQQQKKRDGDVGKHKLNEMGALNIK